ncbi:outer dynein arm light chain 8, partial [Reticulomyxa filosa]
MSQDTKKAVVKIADMSTEMQVDAALEKLTVEKDVAAHIKKEFDKKHGPTWHCVVGRNFGIRLTVFSKQTKQNKKNKKIKKKKNKQLKSFFHFKLHLLSCSCHFFGDKFLWIKKNQNISNTKICYVLV